MAQSRSKWPKIPGDAVTWFRRALRNANSNVTNRMVRVPNIRETSLDDGLVESLVDSSGCTKLDSGTVVQLEVHNIGGLRRYAKWETADIAFLVLIFRNGYLLDRKIGLLQSKRLFPENKDVEEDDPVNFDHGMNRFLGHIDQSYHARKRSHYKFNDKCKYASLKNDDEQIKRITELNSKLGECTYYLFYNPPVLPLSIVYPHSSKIKKQKLQIGARVSRTNEVEAALSGQHWQSSPTYEDIKQASVTSNWPLEKWGADHLLRCKVGKRFGDGEQLLVNSLLERRSGPIASAIAVKISLPPE